MRAVDYWNDPPRHEFDETRLSRLFAPDCPGRMPRLIGAGRRGCCTSLLYLAAAVPAVA
jgi:hypothetical protein